MTDPDDSNVDNDDVLKPPSIVIDIDPDSDDLEPVD